MTEELIFVVPQSYLSESRSESLRDVNVKKMSVKVLPLITSIEVTLEDWIERIHSQSEKRNLARMQIFNSCFFAYETKK